MRLVAVLAAALVVGDLVQSTVVIDPTIDVSVRPAPRTMSDRAAILAAVRMQI